MKGGTAETARGAGVGLGKRLENSRGLFRRHAYPGVGHGEANHARLVRAIDQQRDSTAFGEFDRIAD